MQYIHSNGLFQDLMILHGKQTSENRGIREGNVDILDWSWNEFKLMERNKSLKHKFTNYRSAEL